MPHTHTSKWATKLASALIAAALLAVSAPALMAPSVAHEGATGIVKERMDLMEGVGDTMKAMGRMAQTGTFDRAALENYARELATAFDEAPALFPEGSDQHPTKTKPLVWQEFNKFEAIFVSASAAASDLAGKAATASDAELLMGVQLVGDSCRQCHRPYRERD